MTKPLIILCLLFWACSVPVSGNAADDLQLRVELTTGERSRDSSMQTTTISIAPQANTIVWERTVSAGLRLVKTFPSREEYKLSRADKRKLIALIESGHLLTSDSIKLPPDTGYPPTHQYFVITIEITLNGKSRVTTISGPRNATQVKEEKLYQDAIALVKELYRIINKQGGRVVFQELVIPKRTRPQGNRPPVNSKDTQGG